MSGVSFEQFREQWVEEIREGSPSSAELGRRFAYKLFSQWRDVSNAADDLTFCDGPYDGGIDLAYLERGESDPENITGDSWYLVQSKFGSSFQSEQTVLLEGKKLLDTLDDAGGALTENSASLVARVKQFLAGADHEGSGDRLIFVLVTELPLNESERRALNDVRSMGRHRFGNVFDVESVSIETIYSNQSDDPLSTVSPPIVVQLEATLTTSGRDLMVGSIPLLKLYEFLKAYRDRTENLDQLYEKNVRRFLGGRGKVNKGMQKTLNENPAQFGLYNNGITLVVKDFAPVSHSAYSLTEPNIVNGCQTTRTIWEVFRQKLESGGKGKDPKLEQWTASARDGVVIAKVVRVGDLGEQLLENITRFTNSQNAVKDKDFITLDQGFSRFKHEMASKYGVFLEVQRGGWDSQKALQKQNPKSIQFTKTANAFDLLKVYGAGWLREAGRAFGSNKSFAPGGRVYQEIVGRSVEPFGVDDLYAAYVIQQAADERDFGRGSKKVSRRQTRFLFYMVTIDFLRDVLVRANRPSTHADLTQALLKLKATKDSSPAQCLFDAAVGVVDEYLTQGEEDSVFQEEGFKKSNSDLNSFLKSEHLGSAEITPKFATLMAINKRTLGRGNPSPRELITAVVG